MPVKCSRIQESRYLPVRDKIKLLTEATKLRCVLPRWLSPGRLGRTVLKNVTTLSIFEQTCYTLL